MSKSDETLNKAFGSIPNELPGKDIWDWIPTRRGIKYYIIVYWRKLIR